MGQLKHLPLAEWPQADHAAFESAYTFGDIFDDTPGAGARWSDGTRDAITVGWRRWLGFLASQHPGDLLLALAARITPERVRAYVEHLNRDMIATSVATTIAHLYDSARVVGPAQDWAWLKALKSRLQARAQPRDRFDRLVPGSYTLDLGIALMDEALAMKESRFKERELLFRDGLLLTVLSLWLLRRRSLAALSVSNLRLTAEAGEMHLDAADTKGKRDESWSVPNASLPYLQHYLDEIRPRLLGSRHHDALWVSAKHCPLSGDRIYNIVADRTEQAFGKRMALHDFRRVGPTFLAMNAPEKIGLSPGILQHASPETSDRHYNLARSAQASRRHANTVQALRERLRAAAEEE